MKDKMKGNEVRKINLENRKVQDMKRKIWKRNQIKN